MGLVTPLILYGRVIFSRVVEEPYFTQSFLEPVPSTFDSRCLLTPNCVSPNVALLIIYGLYHLQGSKTFTLARVASTTTTEYLRGKVRAINDRSAT